MQRTSRPNVEDKRLLSWFQGICRKNGVTCSQKTQMLARHALMSDARRASAQALDIINEPKSDWVPSSTAPFYCFSKTYRKRC
jgi:hypothetical protein